MFRSAGDQRRGGARQSRRREAPALGRAGVAAKARHATGSISRGATKLETRWTAVRATLQIAQDWMDTEADVSEQKPACRWLSRGRG
jgi:hypothetical protein